MTSEALDPVDLFLAYSFSEDAVYQQGVESIVASGAFEGKLEEERAMLVRSSQVFYFNRAAGSSITVDDVVQRERQRRPTTNVVNGNAPPTDLAAEPSQQSLAPEDEPRTLSFAELKALIEQGKTDQIPNNRQIPDELNQAPPSQSTASVLKKPWETRQ
ncbi:uncharacterized protein B0H18DRAFT_885533 [Fomitopsis serialis]|uniref:uncharacterized protein n=1 Tax=Fomitopsis serialis TaxID=139415 RepID=UPI0020074A3D|nr:uncharacterized protein B0H18DRAFT_885533 [Neoantrodia serialis]KAH9915755.1 hypothetical protein B0H18DRAFT_885533 [Neoantrodia serialis]